MQNIIQELEASQLKQDIPDFQPGDTIRVSVRIVEGDKTRLQDFQGVCIGRRGSGIGETFIVRRVSYGVGMERVFPLHSPRVEGIKVIRHGKVRRAKLYYLRGLRGKKARIQETRRPARKSEAVAAALEQQAEELSAKEQVETVAPAEAAEQAVAPGEEQQTSQDSPQSEEKN